MDGVDAMGFRKTADVPTADAIDVVVWLSMTGKFLAALTRTFTVDGILYVGFLDYLQLNLCSMSISKFLCLNGWSINDNGRASNFLSSP